jgi:hypothetical protein
MAQPRCVLRWGCQSAPTSMVRKSVTTRWFRSSSWYESSTNDDMLCSTSRPRSQRLRPRARACPTGLHVHTHFRRRTLERTSLEQRHRRRLRALTRLPGAAV